MQGIEKQRPSKIPRIKKKNMGNIHQNFIDYPIVKDDDTTINCPADILESKIVKNNILNLPKSKKNDKNEYYDLESFPKMKDIHNSSRFLQFLKWRYNTKEPLIIPSNDELNKKLPIKNINQHLIKNAHNSILQSNQASLTWLGHASVLLQISSFNILTDPIFSERCSPLSSVGPKRYRKSPIKDIKEDLPDHIDIILISHNHYDHLDINSCLDLSKKLKIPPLWLVPLGTKEWFINKCKIRNVLEFDWCDSIELNKIDTNDISSSIKISCLPCQHWCSRTMFDRNKALWASWLVESISQNTDSSSTTLPSSSSSYKFYFGGDTGFCEKIFAQIGQYYKKIDIAALPIGAYGSKSEQYFHKYYHMNPFEAYKTSQLLNAHYTLGIHHGTFPLTNENIFEPSNIVKNEIKDENFFVLNHGESIILDL